MVEPAVTLTDYALAAECGILAIMTSRRAMHRSRVWFVLFFAALGLAAMLGGTVHGFVSNSESDAYTVLWGATLVSIGVGAVAAALAAATSIWGETVRRIVLAIAVVGFVAYCYELLSVGLEYRLAIIVYLPATVFLLVSFVVAYLRERLVYAQNRNELLLGAFGLVLTFIAAGVQQSSVAIGALDHNAIYHIIQAFALLAIYAGATSVMRFGTATINL